MATRVLNRRNSLRQMVKAPFYMSWLSSADTDMASGRVDLITAMVSDVSRTNQDEQEINRIEKRVTEMLRVATNGHVHVDNVKADRVEGVTHFVLSNDSCFDVYKGAILHYADVHFDPQIVSVSEQSVLVPIRDSSLPVPYSQMRQTLVVSFKAIIVSYTMKRYLLQKAITGAYCVAIAVLLAADWVILRRGVF